MRNKSTFDEDSTEEKTKTAHRNVKIDALRSKGFSERDAVIKGSKEQVPSPKPAGSELPPSDTMSDGEIDQLGSAMAPGVVVELTEGDLGGAPEVGATVQVNAVVHGIHLKEDGSKCYTVMIGGPSPQGDDDDGRNGPIETAENEAPEAVEEVPEEEA